MSEFTEQPPFDADVHLCTPPPTEEQQDKIKQFREQISANPLYAEHETWLTNQCLQRFLIARNYELDAAVKLMQTALEWRTKRKPALFDQREGWLEYMSKESETGKIYCPGRDRWGRSVLVFDNTVQNTPHVDDHMNFLAWNLEFAIKQMPPTVDKYTVFIHLENFSFFNIPPFASTRETLLMLCNTFPERLGHLIAYKPPYVFKAFYESVKMFLDPKTVNKIVFIYGDVSEDSANDRLLKQVIGDDWKVLTGAEQPVLAKNTSPGYDHAKFWPTVMQRYEALNLPCWVPGRAAAAADALPPADASADAAYAAEVAADTAAAYAAAAGEAEPSAATPADA